MVYLYVCVTITYLYLRVSVRIEDVTFTVAYINKVDVSCYITVLRLTTPLIGTCLFAVGKGNDGSRFIRICLLILFKFSHRVLKNVIKPEATGTFD